MAQQCSIANSARSKSMEELIQYHWAQLHTLKILKPICYMLYEGINWSLPKALSPQQVVLKLGF